MEVKAHAKFLRLSPRKARYIVNILRGKRALDAIAKLKLHPQKAAKEVIKLLNSALANAQHNLGLSKDSLVIKEISANVGPTFKRYKPRARGQADVIKRKMTHLSVVLESVEGAELKGLIKEEAKTKKIKKEAKAKPQKIEKVQKEEQIVKEKKKKESPPTGDQPQAEKAKKPVSAKITETKKEKEDRSKAALKKKRAEHVKKMKEETFKQKEKFAKKESFFSGIKRFFRRKGF